jgi:hypothetical protein
MAVGGQANVAGKMAAKADPLARILRANHRLAIVGAESCRRAHCASRFCHCGTHGCVRVPATSPHGVTGTMHRRLNRRRTPRTNHRVRGVVLIL